MDGGNGGSGNCMLSPNHPMHPSNQTNAPSNGGNGNCILSTNHPMHPSNQTNAPSNGGNGNCILSTNHPMHPSNQTNAPSNGGNGNNCMFNTRQPVYSNNPSDPSNGANCMLNESHPMHPNNQANNLNNTNNIGNCNKSANNSQNNNRVPCHLDPRHPSNPNSQQSCNLPITHPYHYANQSHPGDDCNYPLHHPLNPQNPGYKSPCLNNNNNQNCIENFDNGDDYIETFVSGSGKCDSNKYILKTKVPCLNDTQNYVTRAELENALRNKNPNQLPYTDNSPNHYPGNIHTQCNAPPVIQGKHPLQPNFLPSPQHLMSGAQPSPQGLSPYIYPPNMTSPNGSQNNPHFYFMTNHPYFTPNFDKHKPNQCETSLGEPIQSKPNIVHPSRKQDILNSQNCYQTNPPQNGNSNDNRRNNKCRNSGNRGNSSNGGNGGNGGNSGNDDEYDCEDDEDSNDSDNDYEDDDCIEGFQGRRRRCRRKKKKKKCLSQKLITLPPNQIYPNNPQNNQPLIHHQIIPQTEVASRPHQYFNPYEHPNMTHYNQPKIQGTPRTLPVQRQANPQQQMIPQHHMIPTQHLSPPPPQQHMLPPPPPQHMLPPPPQQHMLPPPPQQQPNVPHQPPSPRALPPNIVPPYSYPSIPLHSNRDACSYNPHLQKPPKRKNRLRNFFTPESEVAEEDVPDCQFYYGKKSPSQIIDHSISQINNHTT